MAHTARDDEDLKERFDSEEELERKVETLARWVRESKHFIVFTGAGISTTAGIPDFRSGMNTVLPTGPGVWELQAKGQLRDSKHRVTSASKAIPTPTHMTFVKLHQEGLLKCVISQNCDGLHRRSGMPKSALFELHGNSNVEKCERCNHEYLRDFRAVGFRGTQHVTGRRCDDPKCQGRLKDTIINFGENLPTDTLETSFDHAAKADLCLAMGSSLTVTPAADIPRIVGERLQNLVIVNLQPTPLDGYTKLRIFAKTDDVSHRLMQKLGLEIPEFRLRRKVIMSAEPVTDRQTKVAVQGADAEGYPFSFLKEIQIQWSGKSFPLTKEPFELVVECGAEEKEMGVTVVFHAHYGEPPVKEPLRITGGRVERVVLSLEFNPFTLQWGVTRSDQDDASGLVEKVQAATI